MWSRSRRIWAWTASSAWYIQRPRAVSGLASKLVAVGSISGGHQVPLDLSDQLAHDPLEGAVVLVVV